MSQPQILILDPALARETLAEQIRQQGYRCDVAQGLHDAMVQCIIRKPVLIVADMSIPGGCGDECRQRIGQLPHLQDTSFLMIDGTSLGLPTNASNEDILARIKTHLPVTKSKPIDTTRQMPAPPPLALVEILAQLAEQGADASVGVTDSDNRFGEILVRGGEPIHAVTEDGLSGPAAMTAISAMDLADVTLGPAPRTETPHTLSRPEPETTPTTESTGKSDTSSKTPPVPEPPAVAPGVDTSLEQAELLPLLEELAALGIVTKVQP